MRDDEDNKGRGAWVDRRDFVGLVGVSLIGVGCWWIFPASGLIVPGVILSAVAIFGVKN